MVVKVGGMWDGVYCIEARKQGSLYLGIPGILVSCNYGVGGSEDVFLCVLQEFSAAQT